MASYAAKKAIKPGPIAKSQILLDCKPWDDETDMKAMEDMVRTITMDGLRWGASKCIWFWVLGVTEKDAESWFCWHTSLVGNKRLFLCPYHRVKIQKKG